MKKNRRTLMLGIFVLVGLAAFTYAIFYVGQNKNMFSSNIFLNCVFKNVKGLEVGNKVRFAGIKVGSVSNITIITDTTILVQAIVETKIQKFLKTDSRMSIGSDGLMGDKLIDLTPGSPSAKMIESNATILAVKPLDIDGILNSAQATLANVEILSEELAQIAHKANHSDGIVRILLDDKAAANKVRSILNNTDKATANLAEDLKAAQSNFLLKGYFKKKNKEKQEKKETQEKINEGKLTNKIPRNKYLPN